jgi:hypothetical protein
MVETRYWKCDGCGAETKHNPETGTFIRYSFGSDEEYVPMMCVVFVDQSPGGNANKEPEHICLDCYSMIFVSNGKAK